MFFGPSRSAGNFDQLAEHLHQMLGELQVGHFFRYSEPHAWRPKVNIYETAESYFVCIEIAGMPREQIEVRAEGNTLHIHGTRPKPDLTDLNIHCTSPARIGVHLMEIDSGLFSRRIPLPSDVEVSAISATYRNGYLWVTLPKSVRNMRGAKS